MDGHGPVSSQSSDVRLGDLGGRSGRSLVRLLLSAVPHIGPGTRAGFKKRGWNWTGSQAIDRSRNCLRSEDGARERIMVAVSTRWTALPTAHECREAVLLHLVPTSCFSSVYVSYIGQGHSHRL